MLYITGSGHGGGYLEISAFGSIVIGGDISANGSQVLSWQPTSGCGYIRHRRGSGGTLVLRTLQPLILKNSAELYARRGGDNHPNGLIRLESPQPATVLGTCSPTATIGTPQEVLGHTYSVSRMAPFEITESDNSNIISSNSTPDEGYGVCTTLRGARWVTFPGSDEIHPYGRNGSDLLPNKTYSTGLAPRGIAADRFDRIWVACGGGELRQHNAWGQTLQSIVLPGEPFGVAVDSQDRIWVTCSLSNQLHCVDQDGTILNSYNVGNGPRGIAIDANDDIWITLTGGLGSPQGQVAKIDPQGNMLFTVNVDRHPLGIACDGYDRAWVACEGDLVSPGSNVFRIAVDGTSVDAIGVGHSPTSISVGGDGSIWVVNSGNFVAPASELQQLDPLSGALVHSHTLPDLSIAFGDATGFAACITFDKFGDFDGDGESNFQEASFLGDPFDPTKQSQNTTRTISSVTPETGMMAGGTPMTITGGPFTYSWATNVSVNGVAATNVQVVDVNTITCETGLTTAEGRGDVVVNDPAGTITATQAFRYSNIGLFATPANGQVALGNSFSLQVESHPFTTFWLLGAVGTGSHALTYGPAVLQLEVPTNFVIIFDPNSTPFGIGTNAAGVSTLTYVVPPVPSLSGLQVSFVAATIDPACFICSSNGVVITAN